MLTHNRDFSPVQANQCYTARSPRAGSAEAATGTAEPPDKRGYNKQTNKWSVILHFVFLWAWSGPSNDGQTCTSYHYLWVLYGAVVLDKEMSNASKEITDEWKLKRFSTTHTQTQTTSARPPLYDQPHAYTRLQQHTQGISVCEDTETQRAPLKLSERLSFHYISPECSLVGHT